MELGSIKLRLKSAVFRNLALLVLLFPLFLAGQTYSSGKVSTAALQKSLSIPHAIGKKTLKVVSTPLPVISLGPKAGPGSSPSVESAVTNLKVSITEDPKPEPSSTSTFLENRDQIQGGGDINVEVNAYRQKNGKSPLSVNNGICEIANKRVVELKNNFTHQNWSGPIHELGFKSGAENIAMGSKGANYVVFGQWAKSSGHNANMLGDFTMGCGVYNGRYAVYLFAK